MSFPYFSRIRCLTGILTFGGEGGSFIDSRNALSRAHMLEEEAETLSSDATLGAAQIEYRFKIIDVKNDLIITDGEGIEIIEVREQKTNFRGVVPHSPFRITSGPEGSR